MKRYHREDSNDYISHLSIEFVFVNSFLKHILPYLILPCLILSYLITFTAASQSDHAHWYYSLLLGRLCSPRPWTRNWVRFRNWNQQQSYVRLVNLIFLFYNWYVCTKSDVYFQNCWQHICVLFIHLFIYLYVF